MSNSTLKNRHPKTRIFCLTSALFFQTAVAQEIPEHYHPIRPNAMGGAFTAVANDENSVWTNPAGIARVKKARSNDTLSFIKIPNMVVGANKNSPFFQSFFGQATGESAIQDQTRQTHEDKPMWAMIGVSPMIIVDIGSLPSAFGGFSHLTVKATVDKENVEQTHTQMIWDTGYLASIAWTNRSNRFNIGLQARSIARGAYEEFIPRAIITDRAAMHESFNLNSNTSTAVAVDVGMMWTIADLWFPTFGISILNLPTGCKDDYLNPFSKVRERVCGTLYSGKIQNPDAISVVDPTDVRVGLSITPRISRKLGIRMALDMHHLYFASGTASYGLSAIPLHKKIHAGLELFTGNPLLPSPFSVSTGISQGHYTVGGSLRFGAISFDIATFGKDISTTDAPIEDRRTMAGFSFIF